MPIFCHAQQGVDDALGDPSMGYDYDDLVDAMEEDGDGAKEGDEEEAEAEEASEEEEGGEEDEEAGSGSEGEEDEEESLEDSGDDEEDEFVLAPGAKELLHTKAKKGAKVAGHNAKGESFGRNP